jgi:hypothetical protein
LPHGPTNRLADVSGFQAEVATKASALALCRPGSGLEPDILKISIFAGGHGLLFVKP